MTKHLNHVLIMAGGTGGHVFPGLAVADYLKEQGVEVSWLGTARGLEADLVPDAGISFYTIDIKGLRGKGLKTLLLGPFKVLQAIWQARKIIAKLKPDVVLGMGGFASGPGGVAAFMQGCPLVVHEQNARAGLTNKILSYFSKYVLAGFPGAFANHEKVVVVGNPARKSIEALNCVEQKGEANRSLRLLVVGGSLGAVAINQLLPEAIAQIASKDSLEVWHQTGKGRDEQVREDYAARSISARVDPFIKDMAAAYEWADLVVCRSGALTVTELCVAGLGAVFIPFPYAVDDHQTANAQFMVESGAAICIQQKGLDAARLAELLQGFVSDPAQCQKMAQAAYQLRKINVPERISGILGGVTG